MSEGTSGPAASWPSFALPQGTVVNGYHIEQVLGSGGFGITYLAHDLLKQRFAIKEYYPRQFGTRNGLSVVPASAEDVALFEECRERFLREAQALVLLGRAAGTSDGIVRVRTYFEINGTCFLVMDYIEGASLSTVMRREPMGLTAERVRSLLMQLLSSIRIVHRAGLMHRDIKPANIILRDDDRAVLIDFGSTRQAARSDTTTYTQIYSGGYAPPEQMLGLRQGEYSDIYAIGAVCYRAIGGTVVDAMTRQNAVAAGRADPQPPAEQIGAERYPRQLLAVIDAALAIDATQRPQNVDDMLATLGRGDADDDATIVARKHQSPATQPQRRRGAWGAAAGVGVLALVGAGYWVLRDHPTTPPAVTRQEVAAITPAPAAQRPITTPPSPLPQPRPPEADGAPPQATAMNEQPAAQIPVAPSPSPPAERPQREAIAVPPPPVQVPAATPLEIARAAARSVPCSVLNVAGDPDGMRVSGVAQAGQELDRLLADLGGADHYNDDITRIDRFACGPIAVVGDLVRDTWYNTKIPLAIQLDQRNLVSGARLVINVSAAQPALYIDLYQADGSVHHLLRPARSGATGKQLAGWIATPPPGQRLVVALGTAKPLDLDTRPETEKAADYLAALLPQLQNAAEQPTADLAIVTVHAAEPVAKAVQPHPSNLRSDKCANIVSRVQLGETLSDAELAALRTECRS